MKQRGGDFKSPANSTPDSPGNAKKKRRTSTVTSASLARTATPPAVQTSPMPELIPPPPMSGFGDTIIASNPFDDTPAPRSVPQQMPPHMGMNMPPRGPPPNHFNQQMMNQQMMNQGMPMHNGPPMSPQFPHGGGRDGMMPGNMGMSPQQMQHLNMNSPRPQMMNQPMMSSGPMGPMPPHNGQNNQVNQGGAIMSQQNMNSGPGPMPMHANGMGMNQNWNAPPAKPMPIQSGKVYPPDMAMVFNPANPNAPPIYPCGICHKEVHDNDQAIPCESGCNFFFHRECTGLTEAGFHFLNQEVYAEWVCDKCLSTKNIPLVKYKP